MGAIRPHEEAAPAHEGGLGRRLDRDGVLRNPIIVAEVDPGAYVLLDGTHRLAYLKRHGYAWAPAQVVRLADPRSVRLATWAHLARVDAAALPDRMAALGLHASAVPRTRLRARRPSGTDAAWLTQADQPEVVYRLRGPDRVAPLRALVGLYQPERVAPEHLIHDGRIAPCRVFAAHAPRNLLVEFAPFDARDIAALFRAGVRIPSGISRVLVAGGRILGANVPLRLLEPGTAATRRSAWLDRLVGGPPSGVRRVCGPAVVHEPGPRLYAEPLVVFDPALPLAA